MKPMTEQERAEYSRNYDATHHVSEVHKIPNKAHYAVLRTEQRSYPDPYEDTNRGGTATITDSHIEYIYFDDERALNAWILKEAEDNTYTRKAYRVFYVNPVEVKLHTTLELKK